MEGIYKKLAVLLAIVLTSTFASCGGGGGGTTPATGTDPISLDSIGSDGVAADSSFLYTFSKAVDTSLVDTSSFFMHTATSGSSSISMKDAYDSTTCDVSQAIAATVTCSSSTACVLDPTSDLTAGATYIACILPGTASSENIMASNNLKETNSPGSGIFFDDETAFDGYSKQI